MGLRDWNRAVKRIERWEEAGAKGARPETTIEGAIESYLGDCRARNLKASTIASYEKTLEHLKAFAASRAFRSMDRLDLVFLTDFRASRDIAPSTSGKELETLRAFCAFAQKRKWIIDNYAAALDAPKEDGPPTLPFTRPEVDAILDACDRLTDDNPLRIARTRARARGLVLLMLYSGLRISDAVKLARSTVDLETGRLLLRVMKTGSPLYVRLGKKQRKR